MYNSVVGFPLSFFGVVDVPGLSAANPEAKDIVRLAHFLGGYGLVALVVAHVCAAFYHDIVLRDVTLSRMLPSLALRKWKRS